MVFSIRGTVANRGSLPSAMVRVWLLEIDSAPLLVWINFLENTSTNIINCKIEINNWNTHTKTLVEF